MEDKNKKILEPTGTVYSIIWPETRSLIRGVFRQETDVLMSRHENAYTKHQDTMHVDFFRAWKNFANDQLSINWMDFPEIYPTAGASEGIREILSFGRSTGQDLIVFDGEYEGYEALARPAGTKVHIVSRHQWRETLDDWEKNGSPWSLSGAQFWISQPSSIDGCVWQDMDEFLKKLSGFSGVKVWIDLAYLGLVPSLKIDLTHPVIAGFVFSLSKTFGVYYRRIGGVFSRSAIPGLWGNRWFKSLDSLYIGQRLLEEAKSANENAELISKHSKMGQSLFSEAYIPVWLKLGVHWKFSDVPFLIYASDPNISLSLMLKNESIQQQWKIARRGKKELAASRRLCLTPFIEAGILDKSEDLCKM